MCKNSVNLNFIILRFIFTIFNYACVFAHMLVYVSALAQRSLRFCGAQLRDNCELFQVMLGTGVRSFARAVRVLTSESSLQT